MRAFFAVLVLGVSAVAFAAERYLCTIVSTATVSRSMADAGTPSSPPCPTVVLRDKLAVQCDVSACVAAGRGNTLEASCAWDGGTTTKGTRIQANALVDIPMGSTDNNLATLAVSGTATCDVYRVSP
jgi:hypothetical protein